MLLCLVLHTFLPGCCFLFTLFENVRTYIHYKHILTRRRNKRILFALLLTYKNIIIWCFDTNFENRS